jgi:CDP-diacylglycerol--serine O-phosphatidyltransferase
MNEPIQNPPPEDSDARLKIYFLPNLLTAGNLFCGFVALTKIVEADPNSFEYFGQINLALAFILLACIFDLFDGRVARMGGVESPFGREFDSLADLISFGVAPAFLVQRVVLRDAFIDYPQLNQVSWFIASIYLLCGAFRLARFNCLAAMPSSSVNKDFLNSLRRRPCRFAHAPNHSFQRKGKKPRQLELSDRVCARVFVRNDGQHRALSKLQIARPALDHDLLKDNHRRAVRRLHFNPARKNPLLRPARVFHRISGLRLCAAEPFARVAA